MLDLGLYQKHRGCDVRKVQAPIMTKVFIASISLGSYFASLSHSILNWKGHVEDQRKQRKSNLEYQAQNRCLNIVDFSMEDGDHDYDYDDDDGSGSDDGDNDYNDDNDNNGYMMCW